MKHVLVVGDRVRRKVPNPNNADIVPGMTGTVHETFGVSAHVHWDNLPNIHPACREGNDFARLEYLGSKVVSDLKPTNPKDRAATYRLDLSLFPETARIFGAIAMTEGDCKYGGYNYRAAGVNVSTYVAALGRHVGKYYDRGEWADEKTGVPHLANALACLAVLIDGHTCGNIIDDRPPKIQGDLYTWAEALSKSLHARFPEGPARCTENANKGAVNGGVPDWLTPQS